MQAGDQIGKYVLESPLGRGGMAQVWAARAEGPQNFIKPVALKFILPSHSQDAHYGELFFNEAKVAAGLHHANLVTVFDFDKVSDQAPQHLAGLYYIAMERVEGRDLSALLRTARDKGHPLSADLVVYVMAQILEGLRYLHERQRFTRQAALVHRDLSPHNVLLGYGGEVKISDFGIAKLQSSTTTGGSLYGKLAYLAPEVLEGRRATVLTDQFAAGIIFWEMLTGESLFQGNNDAHTLEKVRRCQIPDPERPGQEPYPADLRAVVARMLARDPQDRFPTTAAASAAMAALLGSSSSAVHLTETMLALFPIGRDGTAAPQSNRAAFASTHLAPSTGSTVPEKGGPRHAIGPIPVATRPAFDRGVEDAPGPASGPNADENLKPASDSTGSDTRQAEPSGGTRLLVDAAATALPVATRTIPPTGIASKIPRRLQAFARDAQFAVEKMPAHFEAAEVARQAAQAAGHFAGSFEEWLIWNAERGRDAISGRALPEDYLDVARWRRFTDVGWARKLTFNWCGTIPWGDDGYWIAEDAIDDEMMVLYAADLERPAFQYVTPEQWRTWWQSREINIDTEGPGGIAPVSRKARELLGQKAGSSIDKTEWTRKVQSDIEVTETATFQRLQAQESKAQGGNPRASFWQKLTRLSR